MTEGYQGWKNYETWSVTLVVDNDERTYNERRAIVAEAALEAEATDYWTIDEARRYAVADALKEWIEAAVPEMNEAEQGPLCYLWSQLISAALSEVDWTELAESWLEDVDLSELRDEDDEDVSADA